MEIIFDIQYDEEVVKVDIKKLDKKTKSIMKKQIESKLTTRPDIFGKPLRSSLYGFRSLRVGDYRIIYEISLPKTVIIRVIQKRSISYKTALSPACHLAAASLNIS